MEQQPNPFASVRSSAVDGRLQTPFLRKDKLRDLHKALVENAAQILESISTDATNTTTTEAEIQVEFGLALQSITDAHASIDSTKFLHDEYAVARNENADHARDPVGIVVIEPSTYCFLNSLISSLAPAIAAGNCTIVQVEQNLYRTPRLVLDILSQALGNDIFAVTTKPVTDEDIGHRHIRVLQNGSKRPHLTHHIVSLPNTPVIAFVERDADVNAAAKAIAKARLGGGGRSPYAPDVVLVNEWVKKAFMTAATEAFATTLVEANGSLQANDKRRSEKLVEDVTHRPSVLSKGKVSEPQLVIHACSSIDDAIDASNKIGHLAAAYVFTTPTMAKYFTQFIDAEVSFVNHVPSRLLYGPIAPQGRPPKNGTQGLYDAELFSVPRPVYVTPTEIDRHIGNVLQTFSPRAAQIFVNSITKDFLEPKRRARNPSIGFFEQGIVTGLVLTLGSILTGTGVAGYYALRYYRGL